MKKGFSTTGIVISVIVVAVVVIGIVAFAVNSNQTKIDYSTFVGTEITEAMDENGKIADHVIGNPDAPVIIHEYANFQCNHCASMRPYVQDVVDSSNGQVGVVFRNLVWAAFQNSKAAAAASEAAGLQGYWEQYAQKLFDQQAEWSYANASERKELFDKYFEEVTDGKGDLEKFNKDLESDAVLQKVTFDTEVGTAEGATGTPSFFYEGQKLALDEGGDLNVDGKTVHYEKATEPEQFKALIQSIVSAKTSE